jgi:hypothetical protein
MISRALVRRCCCKAIAAVRHCAADVGATSGDSQGRAGGGGWVVLHPLPLTGQAPNADIGKEPRRLRAGAVLRAGGAHQSGAPPLQQPHSLQDSADLGSGVACHQECKLQCDVGIVLLKI